MHIVGLLALLAGAIFFLYRLFGTIDAGKQVFDESKNLAQDAQAFARRSQWNRKRNFNPLDELTDPRQVATVLMLETANAPVN